MQTSALASSSTLTDVAPRPKLTNLVLLTSDTIGLSIAAVLATTLVDRAPLTDVYPVPFLLASIIVVIPLLLSALRLYPAAGLSPIDEMRTLIIAISATFAVLGASLALANVPVSTAYIATAFAWVVAIALVTGGRVLLRHVFADRPWWGVPVVALGAGRTAELVISRLRTNTALNLKVVACLDDDPNKVGTFVAGIPVTGTIDRASTLRRNSIDYAIVAMPGLTPDRLTTLVRDMGTIFSNVVVVPNTIGMTSVGVGTRDSGGIIGLYVRGHLSLRSNLVAKRVIDLMLLVPLGILAVPIITLCAVAVFLASPGNPFYAQEREGYQGRRFRLWKLRTMHLNGQDILEQHLATDPRAQREWETHFKLTNDPRVIPIVGAFLRRASLDELPQIINIARGEMSFVGPRPFPIYHLDQFEPEFRKIRASVAPGLTGYWQVTSRSTADLVMQVELDSYYINNWSLWFDLYVLVRTPWAVLFGTGAH